MVFYFTGTGNSLWMAKEIGKAFSEPLISIADEFRKTDNSFSYALKEDEKVFFVFPVHSWGPAVSVYHFIEKLTFSNYEQQPVYVICTCGDNCGNTDKIVKRLLSKKNITLSGSYSVQMPNNYILMKGFGIDSKELEKEKLQKAPAIIKEIVQNIAHSSNQNFYIRGNMAFLKSGIVYPAFRNFAIKSNSFFVTDDCVSCGLCEKICPTSTIKMTGGKPTWNNTCVQCTACIHRCPVRTIEYGKITQNQGRYIHPDLA